MEPTHFLNVDLDVHSKMPLSELTSALSHVAFNLHEDLQDCEGFARYEILNDIKKPEDIINCFVGALEQLPEKCRQLWDKADVREFSIGIQSGPEPHSSEWRISPGLLTRVGALNAELSVVIYAPEKSTIANIA